MKKTLGFSLIEVLIYSALLALFLGAAIGFLTTIIGTADKLLERGEVYANKDFVDRKITWIAEQATGVSSPAASSTDTTLTFTGPDITIFPATFVRSGNILTLSLAGGSALPLTNTRIHATAFDVAHFSNAQTSSSIAVSITFQSSLYNQFIASTTLRYVIE